MTVQTNDARYACAKLIVDTNGISTGCNYTTITAAIAAASAGDTICIRPGTYIENFTLKPDVNVTTFPGEDQNEQVHIIGKITVTTAGDYCVSNVTLETNSDYAIEVTGTNALTLYIEGCTLVASDNTFINLNNANATIDIDHSDGDIETTLIGMWAVTAGKLEVRRSRFGNSGSTTTASTYAGAAINGIHYSQITFPISISGTVNFGSTYTAYDGSGLNTTMITDNSSQTTGLTYCLIASGTATAVTCTQGVTMRYCTINSSNTNAIDGAGSLVYSNLIFNGSSSNISTTTQTLFYTGPSQKLGSANVGSTNSLSIENTDNTNTSSHSKFEAYVGGGSGGDPYVRWNVNGAQDYSAGIDNTDSDIFKITDDANPSTGNTLMSITSAGEVNLPLQPAFLAKNSTTDTNQTGNSAVVTVEFDNEIFDVNGDYDNTTDTFTAPVTGKYRFGSNISYQNVPASANGGQVRYITSNRTFFIGTKGAATLGGAPSYTTSILSDMDAADTCRIDVLLSGGSTDTADILGDAGGNPATFFYGIMEA